MDLTFDNLKVAIQELNRLKESGLKNFSLRTYRRFNTVAGEVKMEKDIYTFERFQNEKLKRFLESDIFCTLEVYLPKLTPEISKVFTPIISLNLMQKLKRAF